MEPQRGPSSCEHSHEPLIPPSEIVSTDPDVLRGALMREAEERRRAECLAKIQTNVVQFSLDALVREPDVDGFFAVFTQTLVEESNSHAAAIWLIDDDHQRCDLWIAYLSDHLYTPKSADWDALALPRESLSRYLFDHAAGWTETVEYTGDDPRLPDPVREFNRGAGVDTLIVAPLILANRTLGWLGLSMRAIDGCDGQWRVVLLEAMARQATLALHQNRLMELIRLEERRKGILEERNRLARDIHDNLAQGFAAILMQLQAAKRDATHLPEAVASKLETAIDLARTHMTEARRSVGTLRPNVGRAEDVATSLKRLADLAQRTAGVPIEVDVQELPRFGDGVEREIIGIVQEALTNAVRHARARRITIRASAVRSIGVRVSIADDGRGIARERSSAGFGMTSMHERAERIGASLTIVTAPRNGTEVVLAWEPSSLPTQVHVAG
jgi:signal transduction histidine kinase